MTRYSTIVIDPPWDHSDGFASDPHSGRGLPPAEDSLRSRGHVGALPYRSMSTDEIEALLVAELAAPNCRLFLWTTNRYLPDAFGVARSWGFTYRQTLVWHKTGNPSPFGGSVAPNHAEYVLVATKGVPELVARLPSNVVAAPAQRSHSRKPEAFMDLFEAASPAPRLEMFSRRARFGWDTWGNEALHGDDMTCNAPGASGEPLCEDCLGGCKMRLGGSRGGRKAGAEHAVGVPERDGGDA